jgi:hypothetical protein
MTILANHFVLEFPPDYDAQAEYETPSRGYLGGVIVRLEDGTRYQLFFIDPVRLQQELMGQIGDAQPYFWEPNMVVLPQVTTETIRVAVDGLVKDRCFESLNPL